MSTFQSPDPHYSGYLTIGLMAFKVGLGCSFEINFFYNEPSALLPEDNALLLTKCFIADMNSP